MIVLDTSALIRWTSVPEALSRMAAQTISESDQIIVSSISIWEVAWKIRLGKLVLPVSALKFAADLVQVRNVEIVAVDTKTWLRNVSLEWNHRDPADRTIVATADLRRCPLVTSDQRIRTFYDLSVW
jgi:PIN domain nuclease of toxin-antitoxin system